MASSVEEDGLVGGLVFVVAGKPVAMQLAPLWLAWRQVKVDF